MLGHDSDKSTQSAVLARPTSAPLTHARASANGLKSLAVGGLGPGDNAGVLFAGGADVLEMEHHEPIIKSERLTAITVLGGQ
jgi:hypothetical protein